MLGIGAAFKLIVILALLATAYSAFKGYNWIHELPLTEKVEKSLGRQSVRWLVFWLTLLVLIWWFGRMI